MEEDIKILEEIINLYKNTNELPYKFNKNIIQAIENLIEENKTLKNVVSEIFNSEDVTDNYIPKSLVKEKIEELKEKGESDLRTYGFAVETYLAKQVLEELLQEGE